MRDRLYHEVLSRITAPYAYVPELITEGSPACPRGPAAGPGALQPGEQMSVPAVRSHAGQVPDQIANTLRNSQAHPSRSCCFYCMISPIRGNRTGFRVQVPPSDTTLPYMFGQRRPLCHDSLLWLVGQLQVEAA